MKKIIVHGGKAHLDDFLVTCLALRQYGVLPVERREPTSEEIEDVTVLVLDVGNRHDPENNNFDHHQLERGTAECATSLFAQNVRYGGDEYAITLDELLGLTKWYETLKAIDSGGPFTWAKSKGVDASLIFELASPVQEALILMFEKGAVVPRSLVDVMRSIGQQIVAQLYSRYCRIDELGGKIRVIELKGLKGYVLMEADKEGLFLWRERNLPDAAFNITFDDRGPGFQLFRESDHPRIDFTRVKDDIEVSFAHASGFIAKTRTKNIEVALRLVERAIV